MLYAGVMIFRILHLLSVFFCFCYPVIAQENYRRIVSAGLCADGWLLELADKNIIAGVTRGASSEKISAYVPEAKDIPTHNGTIEQIMALKPDMVLVDIYTRPNVRPLLERFGIIVKNIPLSNKMSDWKMILQKAGQALDKQDKASRLKEKLLPVWQNLTPTEQFRHSLTAVIFRPSGYSPGMNTLMGDVLETIGVQNLATHLKMKNTPILPIETLLYHKADILIRDIAVKERHSLSDMVLFHPALKNYQKQIHTYDFDLKYWFCLTPKTLLQTEKLKQRILQDFAP